jgi:hypothetical protein
VLRNCFLSVFASIWHFFVLLSVECNSVGRIYIVTYPVLPWMLAFFGWCKRVSYRFFSFSDSPFRSLPVPTAQLISVTEVLLGQNRYV